MHGTNSIARFVRRPFPWREVTALTWLPRSPEFRNKQRHHAVLSGDG